MWCESRLEWWWPRYWCCGGGSVVALVVLVRTLFGSMRVSKSLRFAGLFGIFKSGSLYLVVLYRIGVDCLEAALYLDDIFHVGVDCSSGSIMFPWCLVVVVFGTKGHVVVPLSFVDTCPPRFSFYLCPVSFSPLGADSGF
ncbi:hypothetical protein L195_g032148 [Trifolium pratense]|uniref:Transmembrane protein n=1 Tax=Trifolium pratense TaxID=57577 RepID=A0A2K3LCE2_TRIPR|nr:hypothetical protein L195_g032148 [Trifolium pratense]